MPHYIVSQKGSADSDVHLGVHTPRTLEHSSCFAGHSFGQPESAIDSNTRLESTSRVSYKNGIYYVGPSRSAKQLSHEEGEEMPLNTTLRRTMLFTLCFCLASFMSGQTNLADDAQTSIEGEKAAVMGKWLILQINRGGQDIDLDELEGAIREIGERTYSITPMRGTTITGRYTIDTESRPRTIDMMVDNGRFAGKTLKGIYRLSGDKLTISFDSPDAPRPTLFESKPGTEYTVAIHKRVE